MKYTLDQSEAEHLKAVAASRNAARLALLDAIQYHESAKAHLEKARREAEEHDGQLGMAVATIAAVKGEKDVLGWRHSNDFTAIERAHG